jgi:hypothetical protein
VAQLDIKNCNVYLRDGYTGPADPTGAVNLMAGYAVGTTVMAVDGFTGAVVTGDYFTVGGRQQRYQITAHTETLGATTQITFTPGLVTAAVDNDVIAIQPHYLQIRIGEGNVMWLNCNHIVVYSSSHKSRCERNLSCCTQRFRMCRDLITLLTTTNREIITSDNCTSETINRHDRCANSITGHEVNCTCRICWASVPVTQIDIAVLNI